MFKEREIYDCFKSLGIETDVKRQKILSQWDFTQEDEPKKINCILLDKTTVSPQKEGLEDAKLE